MNVKNCPSTLTEGVTGYSPAALRHLFNGKKVSHVLSFPQPEKDEEALEQANKNVNGVSISGAQQKLFLVLDGKELRLREEGERSQYILKPIPTRLTAANQVPANEHLTMQLAKQIFNINTAENALIFFPDGEPAYITKRFDILEDGTHLSMEDFASIMGKTEVSAGENYKYESNYEEMFRVLKEISGAYRIESVKLFQLILFNYLFSNGDAHLKNYSLIETPNHDYILSPAYDLLNTRLHIADTAIALKQGLFSDDFKLPDYNEIHGVGYEEFVELGKRAAIPDPIIERELANITSSIDEVKALAKRSFINNATLYNYLNLYDDRRHRLTKPK